MNPILSLTGRRTLLVSLALAGAGCSWLWPKPPVAAPDPQAVREKKLRELGFEKSDDGWVINLGGPLLFAEGSDNLSSESRASIGMLAEELKKLEVDRLRIFGHTDNVGSRADNLVLSSKRANVVANAFITLGFADSKIERKGLGFDAPIATNDTPEGRQQNRRVAVIVPFD
jgi:outer membrane protein OmpA-like peptidoglycan-associated protein